MTTQVKLSQEMIDEYLVKYRQVKELEKELKELRSIIEPAMKETGTLELLGSDRGRIKIETRDMPIMTANFSSYRVEDVVDLMHPTVAKQCIVKVVDRDKLEALIKLNMAPEIVEAHKITKKVECFKISAK